MHREAAKPSSAVLSAKDHGPVRERLRPETDLSDTCAAAAGNLAVARILGAHGIRAKLEVSQRGDPAEEEADRFADAVISGSSVPAVQRKCAGCSTGHPCSDCEEEKLQPKLAAGEARVSMSRAHEAVAAVASGGQPVPRQLRAAFEPRLHRPLSGVRLHTDGKAGAAAQHIGARAYTVGSHIAFAPGEFSPADRSGQQLIAHELVHTIQQGQGESQAIRRQSADPAASTTTPPVADTPPPSPDTKPAPTSTQTGLILDDSTQDVAPNQMKRGNFLAQTRAAANNAAEQALATSQWAPALRPQVNQQLDAQFSMYSGEDATSLEKSIRRQIPGASGVTTASGFISLIAEQVRQTVMEGLPNEDTAADLVGASVSAVSGMAETVMGRLSDVGTMLFKRRDGGQTREADPRAVKSALGKGQPLDGAVRSQMESAFDRSFSNVRVHTGTKAAELSSGLDARAFTVGTDIAFGTGEYQPGTLVGDALVAHELAHVAQQDGAASPERTGRQGGDSRRALEEDADSSAVAAVISLWTGTKGALSLVRGNAMPALRSGLRLQRCSKKTPAEERQERGGMIKTGMSAINRGQSLDAGLWYWPGYRLACQNDPTHTHQWNEATYRLGHTVAPQFTKTGDFHWTLTSGSASAGIRAWLGGLTVADCASAATAIYYDTLRASVGDKKFDEYFRIGNDNTKKTLIISQYPSETPLKDFLYEPEVDDLVEGDWYYWKNHWMYKYKHPAGLWQGENAIYMGKGPNGEKLWSGFGAQNKNGSEMLATLLSEYNAARSADDLRSLKEKEVGGKLPTEYLFQREGGSLIEDLGTDSNVIVNAGGGLQSSGWRLNPLSINALKNK